MRICLLTREFPPLTAYTGGIGRAYAGLARAFADAGHDVTVVVPGLDRSQGLPSGVKVRGIRGGDNGGPSAAANLATVLSVSRELRSLGDVDVVFAPEWHGDAATLPVLPRLPGSLVTNLTTSLEQVRAITSDARRIGDFRPHRIVQSWLERAQTEAADGVVACSGAILDWTRELWQIAEKRTVVIPNGVDVDWIARSSARAPLDAFPRDQPTVVFAGRLEARKGVVELTEAMRMLWRADPAVRLVLVGREGSWQGRPMSHHLRAIAGEHADRLLFLGEQPPEELFPLLAAGDVVALPSLWENLSLVGLEALAAGAPLVATGGTGFADVVRDGENGLLVQPGEPAELAVALSAVLGTPDLRARLRTAAARSARDFDIRAIAQRHVDFFAEVLARSGGATAPVSPAGG